MSGLSLSTHFDKALASSCYFCFGHQGKFLKD